LLLVVAAAVSATAQVNHLVVVAAVVSVLRYLAQHQVETHLPKRQ
jgi:hypothetical protein